MAKKMRKFLAWVMVLTLITGQLAIPAAADETAEPAAVVEVAVDVALSVPEAPAASSQAPAASGSVTVTTAEPVTSSASGEGVTEQSSSTTTTWSGSEGSTSTTGSETTTTVTGTDDTTGQTLYEGGSTEGSETTTTTTTTTSSSTEEDAVNKEIITTTEGTSTESGTETFTGSETSSTDTTGWNNVEQGYTEGQFQVTKTEEWEFSGTSALGEEVISEDGVRIDMTLDTENSNPENGTYTYTGTASSEIIPLEEGTTIPEGATLVKDTDGNIIGYRLETSTTTITGTETKEGNAQLDQANSSTDTTGSTASVTPDLDTAANKLGIHIDNNTQIDEETNDNGDVVAYVITNTTEEERQISAIDELTRPETGAVLQEDGSTITTAVEDILDESGAVIGMKITNVHIGIDGKELSRSETTQTIIAHGLPAAAETKVTYTLPEKPEGSVNTEDGITTTVIVTDILDEDGKVIGYKSTTVKTDEAGAELYREENDLYGTEETIEETVTSANPGNAGTATIKTTVVETSRVTAEETTFEDIATYTRLNHIVNSMTVDKTNEVVMIDGKLYYIYTGSVTVSEGKNHGDTTLMDPITPMSSLLNANDKLDLEAGNQAAGTWYGNYFVPVSQGKPEEGFKYIGSGVNTALTINKGYGNSKEESSVEQFRLISDNGEVYYAMCIDFNTFIEAGHLYDIEDIRDATYLQQSGNEDIAAAEKIRSVALNGYWGTENGVGSMADVQAFLTTYLEGLDANNDQKADLSDDEVKKIVDSLTPGQAQAATQAALWMFGNKDGTKAVNTRDLVGGNNSTDETMVQYLFNALLETANDPNAELEENEGVEFLDAEDITATSIVVKEKVASADDEGNTTGKNIYKTDLNFTLGIEPTKLFGDLKVTVYDGSGKEVKTVILANKDTTLIGLKPDSNGMYTISDIEIAEGVNVNLKLHGTQDLGTGVYIYTSLDGTFNDSQTLVTLATGSRKVDLDISMKLDVQEPTVTKTTSGQTQYGTRTDTQKQTKTDTTHRKSTTTKSEWETVETEKAETTLVYTSDVTLTSVSTRQTKEEKSWTFSWLKTYEPEAKPQDDDVPIDPSDDTPDNRPETTKKTKLKKTISIFDKEVPLAKAPKTGDLSGIWLIISGLSLGGMALLNVKRKEEE